MMQPEALAGIRVVDLSWIVAGPTCTRVLADLGAEVLKVESQEVRDYIRGAPPFVDGQRGVNRSGFFNNLNRNKLGATINVAHPWGMDLLRQIITTSDVLVENFSSRILEERWGLGYQQQRDLRPDIIYCSLSGFGHSGRHQDYTTWGPTAQALSGLTFMSGLPGHEPAGWGYSYMDHTAGYYAAIAILMALHHRNRTGEGQWIDLSQVEAGMVITGTALLDYTVNGRPFRRGGNPPGNRADHPAVAPHNTYRCAGEVTVGTSTRDSRWCAISCFTEAQWEALCRVIGRPELFQDPRFANNLSRLLHQEELDRTIETWSRGRPPLEVMQALQDAGVPAGMVQNAEDKVERDPQLRAREFFVEMEHPEIGQHLFEGVPVKLSGSPGRLKRPAPMLGEHNPYLLEELLGLSDDRIAELTAEGVI